MIFRVNFFTVWVPLRVEGRGGNNNTRPEIMAGMCEVSWVELAQPMPSTVMFI
jgi:hypothetical protein